jgi:dolichol-phosphate mannosyltransferase
VLGSRYTRGGGVRDWSLTRRLISRGGCLYARTLLGLGVHDLTGGFKCFRREVLEAIPLGDVGAAGYVFQIEMTYRALLLGYRVVEVPITFRDRRAGTSKMSGAIVREAITATPLLRYRLRRRR